MKQPATDPRLKPLFDAAAKARENAYCPYSKFRVGAALFDEKGRVFVGCNVENSSYGATVCAERTAIGAMVAAGGKRFTDILVLTDRPDGTPPCGICRQTLIEFAGSGNPLVHIASDRGVLRSFAIDALVPEAFHPGHLQDRS